MTPLDEQRTVYVWPFTGGIQARRDRHGPVRAGVFNSTLGVDGRPGEELQDQYEDYDHRRLDIASLDADGNGSPSRSSASTTTPQGRSERLDETAHCDPEEANWIAMSHDEAPRSSKR